MLRDLAKKYYIDKGLNCTISVLLAANEYYNLGLKDEDAKLVAGFGGGMGCGNVCGALSGAIAAIGLIFNTKDLSFRKICASMVKQFEETLGYLNCSDLTPKYKKPVIRCLEDVELCLGILENVVKENKEIALVKIFEEAEENDVKVANKSDDK